MVLVLTVLVLTVLGFDQVFDQIVDQVFDQVFDQDRNQDQESQNQDSQNQVFLRFCYFSYLSVH